MWHKHIIILRILIDMYIGVDISMRRVCLGIKE